MMSLDISPEFDVPQVHSAAPPRARGMVNLAVQQRDGGTHLAALRQSGCMKCVLPKVFRPDAEAVLVNTAGGVTGGDVLEVSARLDPGCTLSITSQAAERIYKTHDGSTGQMRTRIMVGAGARLNWLPQETILFDRARLRRDLAIDLAPGADLLMCETLVFGRAAMGETVQDLYLEDRITLTRAGLPLYRDGIAVIGDAAQKMQRAAMGAAAGCVATLVFVHPDAQAALASVRALLPATAGASLRGPDLLVLRALAADSLEMRRFMIPVLEHLSGHPLPAVWRL